MKREECRVLTLKQPWAHATIYGRPPKDIENRSWAPRDGFRGRVYIHAGSKDDPGATDAEWSIGNAYYEHLHGAVIGYVTLTGVATMHPSPWARRAPGMWHWIWSCPVPLVNPIFHRGRQGLLIPSRELAAKLGLT